MSAFKSSADADRFALRAKHREWDDGDIEAVWDDAIASLVEQYGEKFFGNAVVTDRCIKIIEERS